MARPKHDDPTQFVVSEVMEATGLDRRTVQLIRDRQAGPFGKQYVMERAKQGFYDENTLAELAMASGVHLAGFPIMHAAAIVRAFLDENSNTEPARFSNTRHLDGVRVGGGPTNYFHAACKTRKTRGGQYSGDPIPGDGILVIADRKYVLNESLENRIGTFRPKSIDAYLPEPLGRIVSIDANQALIASIPSDFEPGPSGDYREAYEVYHKAYRRAVAVIRVNIALAVRNAFDRVQDVRRAKGGPFFDTGGA